MVKAIGGLVIWHLMRRGRVASIRYAKALRAARWGLSIKRVDPESTPTPRRTLATKLLVIFFAVGAIICLVTMFALAFPGGRLESIWHLKPEARVQFQEFGQRASIALMATVGTACGLAAIGLARNAEWGRRLALGILI